MPVQVKGDPFPGNHGPVSVEVVRQLVRRDLYFVRQQFLIDIASPGIGGICMVDNDVVLIGSRRMTIKLQNVDFNGCRRGLVDDAAEPERRPDAGTFRQLGAHFEISILL